MCEHNCHRLSILFLRNERIATSGLQNIKIRFLVYYCQFFRELQGYPKERCSIFVFNSFDRPKLFLHLVDLPFREREGYAWILYPDCVSCTVYFINRSMSPSYFTLANDRITLCTLSYEIRRHLARRLRSGYKNFVESIQSRLWRTIRILFEGRRNESVDRECDERVRRALRNRGERGRWWLEKEEPSARRDRFA